jgi:hypothetical protein
VNLGGEMRRLVPPPRRRPGVLAVLLRWRAELLLIGLVAGLWLLVGGAAVGWIAGVTVLLARLVPPFGHALIGVMQAMIASHRVRSGLVQAGIADRDGRLPWIVGFRSQGDAVVVRLWLNSGTCPDDLRAAAPVIATACGAADIEVLQLSSRQDRAVLTLARPRWGWLTR